MDVCRWRVPEGGDHGTERDGEQAGLGFRVRVLLMCCWGFQVKVKVSLIVTPLCVHVPSGMTTLIGVRRLAGPLELCRSKP